MPRSKTSYSFWLSLSSCSWHVSELPQCIQVTAIAACFMCLVTYFFCFSHLKMGCQNAIKIQKVYLLTTWESFEDLLIHWFPVLVISRKCDKKFEKWAYINPDKSETSQNWIFLFTMIIFVWIFFKGANSVIFSVGFLAESLSIFCGIIGIKIQISIAYLEKTFLSIAYKRHIKNPVKNLQ